MPLGLNGPRSGYRGFGRVPEGWRGLAGTRRFHRLPGRIPPIARQAGELGHRRCRPAVAHCAPRSHGRLAQQSTPVKPVKTGLLEFIWCAAVRTGSSRRKVFGPNGPDTRPPSLIRPASRHWCPLGEHPMQAPGSADQDLSKSHPCRSGGPAQDPSRAALDRALTSAAPLGKTNR